MLYNDKLQFLCILIESITLKDELVNTIDILILDEEHVFVLNNGLLTHNSSITSDLLLGDGISHSMGKLLIADFVLSMSRKHLDKLSNTARFVVVKNRSGRDGMVYNGITNFLNGEIQMFDTYTKLSVLLTKKMDQNEILVKQRVRLRLMSLKLAKDSN